MPGTNVTYALVNKGQIRLTPDDINQDIEHMHATFNTGDPANVYCYDWADLLWVYIVQAAVFALALTLAPPCLTPMAQQRS